MLDILVFYVGDCEIFVDFAQNKWDLLHTTFCLLHGHAIESKCCESILLHVALTKILQYDMAFQKM
jgi:hypothetical protein